VIPSIIIQLASGRREICMGTLSTTRDFTYVEDTCRGLMALGRLEGHGGEVMNIGSNFQVSIGELFERLCKTLGVEASLVTDPARVRPESSEVLRLQCDNTKLRAASGFVPSISLEEGLRRTCEWFRDPSNLGRYKDSLYNV
jgi:nucleoside-diphosphate-sugar epimerase